MKNLRNVKKKNKGAGHVYFIRVIQLKMKVIFHRIRKIRRIPHVRGHPELSDFLAISRNEGELSLKTRHCKTPPRSVTPTGRLGPVTSSHKSLRDPQGTPKLSRQFMMWYHRDESCSARSSILS